ncbi:unnamed protein product [Trichogramma brassicae]|uniref:Uncharacterized protein n=1 Tax=Trichogramma brassicae TaxID=86971 RepID=A0A6H5IWJ2_9HYME|nr:unnamed protein product [Trichogramma brassicae]
MARPKPNANCYSANVRALTCTYPCTAALRVVQAGEYSQAAIRSNLSLASVRRARIASIKCDERAEEVRGLGDSGLAPRDESRRRRRRICTASKMVLRCRYAPCDAAMYASARVRVRQYTCHSRRACTLHYRPPVQSKDDNKPRA